VAAKDLGRGIRIQTRQVGFGISAVKPLCSNQPNLTSGSVWFSCLENLLSLGQKSLASAAGTADPKTHRLAAAREEHCIDNRHALHATGTTRHS
jgi:hypothetical protein